MPVYRSSRDTDYIQQLSNYILKNVSKGYSADSLKWALVSQGHTRTSVEQAMKVANEKIAAQAPKIIEKPILVPQVQTVAQEPAKRGFFGALRDFFS